MSVSGNHSQINEAIRDYQESIANAAVNLERQLQKAFISSEFVGRIDEFNQILNAYLKEHKMDLSTLAMLSGVSPNTMTRIKKSAASSRIDTMNSILDSMGLELIVARKGLVDG